ncbi:tetratricopeptide repeat protein, partial [Acinetobacter baumannii]|uniref:tetratricopeptide repeat protein n=1 Tax=Acinetobacter baumannii TaxID=470 RepID=UPI00148954B5
IVPSARRQRVAGESAYRNGDLDTAKTMLQKATKATRGSVVAQLQDTLLLAQAMVDLGESADAVKVLKDATPAHQTTPTFANVALALQAQAEA